MPTEAEQAIADIRNDLSDIDHKIKDKAAAERLSPVILKLYYTVLLRVRGYLESASDR